MTTAYLIVCALLLLAAIPVQLLPVTPRVPVDDAAWAAEVPWDPRAVAYLRRGTYGLVLTVLAELHARGAVNARVSGRIRQLDPPVDGRYDDPLATAVYLATRWCPEPKLLALLPSVRRAARSVRPDLAARGLLPSARRRLFAWGLLAYAIGFAGASALERPSGSTVVGALAVAALAAALGLLLPRRTMAGYRFLRAERRLLTHLTAEPTYAVGVRRLAPLLASMVAVQGRAALDVLCDGYVAIGALAPKHFDLRPRPVTTPAPAVEPAGTPALEPAETPARTPVPVAAWETIAPSWEWIPATDQPAATRPRLSISYDALSAGPALVVRRAFEHDAPSFEQLVIAGR